MESHLICNNCGGRYQTIYTDSPDDTTTFPDKKSVGIGTKNKVEKKSYRYQCPVCGAVKPKVSYNEENELTYRASRLLAGAKFDEANAAFDEVLAKYPENVEAYWGKVKVRYRVLYKENAKGKMLPTCEKTKQGSVFKDENYQKAYEYADDRIKAFLKKQANEIDRVRGIKQKKALKILTPIFLLAVIALGLGLLFRPPKLSYEVNADGMTCTITDIDTCKDTDIRIPEMIDGYRVTSIGDWAFYYCTSLQSITIPDSVTSIGDYAFWSCTSLTSIVIPDSVTSIGYGAFRSCTSLTSIVIPDSVTSIGGWAFSDCTSLTDIIVNNYNQHYCDIDGVLFNKNVTELICYPSGKSESTYMIPDSVTSIGGRAFSDCTSLTDIIVNNGNQHYCDIDGVLFNKNVTKLICYPAGKTARTYTIPYGVTSIGGSAFEHCTSLTSIVIPDGVTSIGEEAFYDCESLTSIVIPDSVTSIGYGAFRSCTSLMSIVIPDSVTRIGDFAFEDCTSLTSIVILDSVTSIGSYAFYDCESLTEIRYGGTTAQWQKIDKDSHWNSSTGKYTIYCTNGTITKNGMVTPN